jgi:hypothetical protein
VSNGSASGHRAPTVAHERKRANCTVARDVVEPGFSRVVTLRFLPYQRVQRPGARPKNRGLFAREEEKFGIGPTRNSRV